ncbi:hypothetical protein EG68_01866 [Paragonimus skrjabini miyazakii]|uniref:Uncharacterized protein n=1 Tax=Paragonimus skrjabini miyazakii TaxID=59628 RepID=A0A8S9Z1W0_9TREM|nr:hypothetical protein EG68_01866 [Paragonimus skrjabini miyazakii]
MKNISTLCFCAQITTIISTIAVILAKPNMKRIWNRVREF